METYYLEFKVKPFESNPLNEGLAGALAFVWVVEKTPERAQQRAEHYLSEYQWEILSMEQSAIVTNAEHFAQRDIGLQNYNKAQKYGIAVVFSAWEKES